MAIPRCGISLRWGFSSLRHFAIYLLPVLLLWLTGCTSTQLSPGQRDWGPIYSQHTDVDGNLRTRAAGPVYEHVTSPGGDQFTAVRPLYSKTVDAKKEKTHHEVLWPLASSKHWLGEHRWWAGPVLGWNYDVDDPESQKRLWVLPMWFSGKTRAGEDYWALFPIYGNLRDFGSMDEINWQLWPLHVTTRKNDLTSDAWLWPIYSKTTGDDIHRFRVFPFYGTSTFRDDYTKRFIAWPFWTDATYTYDDDPGRGFMLFPLYGQLDSATKHTRWYLPPFFRFENDVNGQKINFPWPLYQYQTGETIDKKYVFPLFGTKKVGDTQSDFWLFPVFWHQQIQRGEQRVDRKLALPVWHHETRTEGDGTVSSRKTKLWPLGSVRREGEVRRTRAFDLWPTVDTAPIERNYAPLWTVYRQDERPGGRSDTEILWGMYRHLNHGPGEKHQSVFPFWERWEDDQGSGWQIGKGLFGMQSGESKKKARVLWFF